MLHDPRHDKTPSLAGFALFVASHEPEERYDWLNCRECAVGRYLTSLDIEPLSTSWGGQIATMNVLAQGKNGLLDWTFGALADRILAYQRIGAYV